MGQDRSGSLAGSVYSAVRNDLYDFRLAPGQRFSENEIAARLGVSRTPVREALYRLRDEGYVDVASKSGWTVRSFEFETFERLYEVRVLLELAAVPQALRDGAGAAARLPEGDLAGAVRRTAR